VDDGWIVEMKIPYRCLRFDNNNIETWGIQFHRSFRRDETQYTWNPIDISKGNIGLYHGELNGLNDLDPPTRLSLYPFVSTVQNNFDGVYESNFNAGLDVKYGLTENFTLDGTLIPDFSHAGFDNITLNLGPFEQTFSDQRQFFTEGIDLFSKGNLFFSRRVGSAPITDPVTSENEEVVDFPESVKVLNAIKISGRTGNGLGLGFFNSFTEKAEATIENIESGDAMAIYKGGSNWGTFIGIYDNNQRVGLNMFLSGLLIGIGTAYYIVVNAIMVAVFQAFFYQQNTLFDSLKRQ
jgi:hypothetical protein